MNVYRKYETLKRQLSTIALTASQYEAVVRLLAEALGI